LSLQDAADGKERQEDAESGVSREWQLRIADGEPPNLGWDARPKNRVEGFGELKVNWHENGLRELESQAVLGSRQARGGEADAIVYEFWTVLTKA
jgi:hypothetical protein